MKKYSHLFNEKWNPETGKYLKNCPVCGVDFEGRLNRIYDNDRCRNKVNNDKRMEEYQEKKSFCDKILKNDTIIKKIWKSTNRSIVLKKILLDAGLKLKYNHKSLNENLRIDYYFNNFILQEFQNIFVIKKILKKI